MPPVLFSPCGFRATHPFAVPRPTSLCCAGRSFWLGAEAPVRCTLERFARDVFDFHAAGSTFDPETSGECECECE